VAAAQAVGRANSDVRAVPLVIDVTPANVEELIAGASVVVDGTDNLETRYLLNDACVRHGIPWVYGGAIGSTGMSMTIIPGVTPCFRCLFPNVSAPGSLETCETAGVLASAIVAVAAHQWTEVAKLIVGARDSLSGGLLALDVWTNDHMLISGVARRPDCPCCALGRFEFLDASATSRSVTLCGRNAIQVTPGMATRVDLAGLGRRLAAAGDVVVNAYLVRFAVGPHELTVFPDGRAIIKGTDDPAEARSLYARWVGV
jgi:adenylyltransferase/sulfurtransferase